MVLKELMGLIEGNVALRIAENNSPYNAISEVPEHYLHFRVTRLEVLESRILISLQKKDPPKSLEELGYSFESGV